MHKYNTSVPSTKN